MTTAEEAQVPAIETASDAGSEIAIIEELRAALRVVPPDALVEYLNALIYGDPGVGKTYFMGTADEDERTRPLLIFDVEGGMKTLANKPGIDVVRVRSMKELQDGYNKLFKSIVNGKMYYKTTGIDSLTELADLDIKTIMREAYDQNPDKIDIDVPDQRGWGKSRNHIRTIVRAFRDLPCHVIYTASIGQLSEEGMPTKYMPGFAGKLRTEVPGFMDIVGHMTAVVHPVTKEVTRQLQVQGTNRVVAKDRTDRLGGIVNDPTIPKLWDLIHSQALSQ